MGLSLNTEKAYQRNYARYKSEAKGAILDLNFIESFLSRYENSNTFSVNKSAIQWGLSLDGHPDLSRKVGEIKFNGKQPDIYGRGAIPLDINFVFSVIHCLHCQGNLKESRDASIIAIMATMGLRRAEVSSIVAPTQGIVTDITFTAKGGGARTLVLPNYTNPIVNRYLKLAEKHKKSHLFFTLDRGTFGHRLSGNAINNIVKSTLGESVTPHSLRKTFATHSILSNPDQFSQVAATLGHKDLSSTLIYFRPS